MSEEQERKKKQVTPSVGLKNALNPRKIPADSRPGPKNDKDIKGGKKGKRESTRDSSSKRGKRDRSNQRPGMHEMKVGDDL